VSVPDLLQLTRIVVIKYKCEGEGPLGQGLPRGGVIWVKGRIYTSP
jgi:hypothetical protein